MVLRSGSHVNILRSERFEKAFGDVAFRDKVCVAYFANAITEFEVTVTTTGNLMLMGIFTASALVQLTNQDWVKSIESRNVARMC